MDKKREIPDSRPSNQILGMERAKQRRREAIFAAAETMIRSRGDTGFSMNELARKASISTYTIYNLIGTKDTVFYTLLNLGIDRIETVRAGNFEEGDALLGILGAADSVVATFVDDAAFYRPLMRHLLGVPDPVNRPHFMARAFDYWLNVVQPAADAGIFREGVRVNALTRTIQVFFTGVTDYWVHAEVTDEEFLEQIRYGVAAFLLASVNETDRSRLIAMMGDNMAGIEAVVARSC
jgi:AcrR family transcriptional regulator